MMRDLINYHSAAEIAECTVTTYAGWEHREAGNGSNSMLTTRFGPED